MGSNLAGIGIDEVESSWVSQPIVYSSRILSPDRGSARFFHAGCADNARICALDARYSRARLLASRLFGIAIDICSKLQTTCTQEIASSRLFPDRSRWYDVAVQNARMGIQDFIWGMQHIPCASDTESGEYSVASTWNSFVISGKRPSRATTEWIPRGHVKCAMRCGGMRGRAILVASILQAHTAYGETRQVVGIRSNVCVRACVCGVCCTGQMQNLYSITNTLRTWQICAKKFPYEPIWSLRFIWLPLFPQNLVYIPPDKSEIFITCGAKT